jgi:hypothetical protein
MKNGGELERELIWHADGHLHDVAVTAIADGEGALLPESARAHAATCDACRERVEHAAWLSSSLEQALGAPQAARAGVERRPFPVAAAVGALLVAALGTLPALFDAGRTVMGLPSLIARARPVVLQTLAALARSVALHGGPTLLLAWCASLVTLFGLGALVAHASTPCKEHKGELE